MDDEQELRLQKGVFFFGSIVAALKFSVEISTWTEKPKKQSFFIALMNLVDLVHFGSMSPLPAHVSWIVSTRH
jgi:hypothetical protein